MQDEGLILYTQFLDGDMQALEKLIALYRHGLLRFIYGYMHDEGLSEDVFQETFVALYYKRFFKPKDGVSFKTYLYTIARNKSLNALKKQGKKREVSLDGLTEEGGDWLEGEAVFVESERLSAQENLEQAERNERLRQAMQKIKEEYREVLILRYFEDLSPERIAKITKRNQKQVYNLLARGKIALKETLEKEGFISEDE